MIGEDTGVLIEKNYDSQIISLFERYKVNGKPIEVSFRKIVPDLNKPDRVTHLVHSYPAKLLMHIPHFFLNNNVLSKRGDLVLDPFSGSGTVLLEAILANRNAIGADSNPLARLISSVKVNHYNTEELKLYADEILIDCNEAGVKRIPYVANVNYWFFPDIQKQLIGIFNAISEINDQKTRDFFWVCYSSCIKRMSLADQRVSVPVKLNPERYRIEHPLHLESKRKLQTLKDINVIDKFREIVEDNIKRFKLLGNLIDDSFSAKIISKDARFLTKRPDSSELIDDNSVNLVISSPPYAGAQKYIRASSLNLGWLDLIKDDKTLKELDALNIGRENYKKIEYHDFHPTGIADADELLAKIFEINPLRAHIAGNYLKEMRDAFKEICRVLKPNGHFILVVGNNQVCGMEFETQEYLRQILEELGLKTVLRLIDDIQSYGLMTKRNKTANVITREWVLIFKK